MVKKEKKIKKITLKSWEQQLNEIIYDQQEQSLKHEEQIKKLSDQVMGLIENIYTVKNLLKDIDANEIKNSTYVSLKNWLKDTLYSFGFTDIYEARPDETKKSMSSINIKFKELFRKDKI